MEEPVKQKKNDYAWLRPVLSFYAKITGWIILPVIMAMFIENEFLRIPAFVSAFLISVYGIYREIKIYQKGLDLEDKLKDKNDRK